MAYLFNDDKSKKYINNGEWVKLTDVNINNIFASEAKILGKIHYKKVGGSVTLKFNLDIYNDDVPANTVVNLLRLSDMPDDIKFEVDSQNRFSYFRSSPMLMIFDVKNITLPTPSKRCVVFFSEDYLRLIILDRINYSNEGDGDTFHFLTEWTYNL